MTNEEKAKELANMWSTDGAYNRAKISAMEMANWKDHQLKEYLEKKFNYTRKMFNESSVDIDIWAGKYQQIKEIINELFPNEEEADYSDNDE